jgi:hypothetical protein
MTCPFFHSVLCSHEPVEPSFFLTTLSEISFCKFYSPTLTWFPLEDFLLYIYSFLWSLFPVLGTLFPFMKERLLSFFSVYSVFRTVTGT